MFNDLLNLLGIEFDENYCRERALMGTKSFRDLVKKSNTISGAFNDLSEQDQEKVVDSFNKFNEMYGNFFGIKTEPYTKEDFKGSKVSVTATGDEIPKENKNEGCGKCDKQQAAPQQTAEKKEQSICDSLYDEMMRENMTVTDAADKVVEKVVSVLRDKKNKQYTLLPGGPASYPAAKIVLNLGTVFNSQADAEYYTRLADFKYHISEKLKKATGSREVIVTITDDCTIELTIALK